MSATGIGIVALGRLTAILGLWVASLGIVVLSLWVAGFGIIALVGLRVAGLGVIPLVGLRLCRFGIATFFGGIVFFGLLTVSLGFRLAFFLALVKARQTFVLQQINRFVHFSQLAILMQ